MMFNQHTTGEEVAKACISRCEGRTCLSTNLTSPYSSQLTPISVVVTGTSEGGIGTATSIALSHGNPKTLFLSGRTVSKITSVIQSIHDINPNITVIFIDLDLSDLNSVREAAEKVLRMKKAEKVHGLINNAGVMCTYPFQKTKQGIELQFGTVGTRCEMEGGTGLG